MDEEEREKKRERLPRKCFGGFEFVWWHSVNIAY
jgi:hypothetical protein